MFASPKPIESADAQVAIREMYYSRLRRVPYPTKAYHHRRPLMAEATGVAGSNDTLVVAEVIRREAFLVDVDLRHGEDGWILRQPLECRDRQEVATTPHTSHEGLAVWELVDNESMIDHGCTSEDLEQSQKKWVPQRHVNWELRGRMRLVNWPLVVEEAIETLVADEMYRRYIDDGQC